MEVKSFTYERTEEIPDRSKGDGHTVLLTASVASPVASQNSLPARTQASRRVDPGDQLSWVSIPYILPVIPQHQDAADKFMQLPR